MSNKKELNKTKQQIHYKKVVEWENSEDLVAPLSILIITLISFILGWYHSWFLQIIWGLIWIYFIFRDFHKVKRKVYWVVGE